MLEADVPRGRHATGVLKVSTKGEPSHFKLAYEANLFLQLDASKNFLKSLISNTVLLGHNRHATKGAAGDHANAHPFKHGHITLVHNGSLNSWFNLTPSGETYSVDSEAIARGIEVYGAKETIKKLNGAFVLVWHDSRDNTLNFCRNTQRDLSIAYNKKQNKIHWASEAGMLKWILDREYFGGVKAIEYDEIRELEPGVLFSVPISGVNIQLDKATEEKVELYSAPKLTSTTRTGGTYGGSDEHHKTIAYNSLERAGRTNDHVRNFIYDCDMKIEAAYLDERLALFYLDYEKYSEVATTGTIKAKMAEYPFAEVQIYGVTSAMNNRVRGVMQGTFTAFLVSMHYATKDDKVIISCNKDTIEDLKSLKNYEFDWAEVPEADEVGDTLANHYLNICADAYDLVEPEELTVKLSDDTQAKVGCTAEFIGKHHKFKKGERYLIDDIEQGDSANFVVHKAGNVRYLTRPEDWVAAEAKN